MVIKNVAGYVITLLGVIGVAAWAIPSFKAAIPQVALLDDTILLAVSVLLALIGIFLVVKGGGRRSGKEVPIYQGKNIVGYRRA